MPEKITELHSWEEFHEAENELRKALRKRQIDKLSLTEEDQELFKRVDLWIKNHRK